MKLHYKNLAHSIPHWSQKLQLNGLLLFWVVFSYGLVYRTFLQDASVRIQIWVGYFCRHLTHVGTHFAFFFGGGHIFVKYLKHKINLQGGLYYNIYYADTGVSFWSFKGWGHFQWKANTYIYHCTERCDLDIRWQGHNCSSCYTYFITPLQLQMCIFIVLYCIYTQRNISMYYRTQNAIWPIQLYKYSPTLKLLTFR